MNYGQTETLDEIMVLELFDLTCIVDMARDWLDYTYHLVLPFASYASSPLFDFLIASNAKEPSQIPVTAHLFP
jgi:hypothetical protein